MKKILIMCLMALTCSTMFTACGDDDDDVVDPNELTDVSITKSELKETANQLVLTYTMKTGGYSINVKWTCDFENDRCVKSVEEMTYPSENIAQLAYEAAKGDGLKVSISGKTVTLDTTDDFAGMEKQYVKVAMEATQNLNK